MVDQERESAYRARLQRLARSASCTFSVLSRYLSSSISIAPTGESIHGARYLQHILALIYSFFRCIAGRRGIRNNRYSSWRFHARPGRPSAFSAIHNVQASQVAESSAASALCHDDSEGNMHPGDELAKWTGSELCLGTLHTREFCPGTSCWVTQGTPTLLNFGPGFGQ